MMSNVRLGMHPPEPRRTLGYGSRRWCGAAGVSRRPGSESGDGRHAPEGPKVFGNYE